MFLRSLNPLISRISLFGESLVRLAFPAVCPLCSKSLPLSEKYVCSPCLTELNRLTLNPAHRRWKKHSGLIAEHCSLYEYRGLCREFIAYFKFSHQPWLIQALRQPLSKFLLALSLETRYDALTPIPVTLSRFMERHYNPAEVLAQEISQICGIPVLPLLKKTRSTPAQHDLSGDERKMNLRGCFAVRSKNQIKGLRVLLIDDILTTGSTALEAARVLKQAGTLDSGILTLAKTLEKKSNG